MVHYYPRSYSTPNTQHTSRAEKGGRTVCSSTPPENSCPLPDDHNLLWLVDANVILEGLWEAEAPIRPGHVERGTDEVVIRVVAEVWNNDRRNTEPVARSSGHSGIILGGCARRTRVYLCCNGHISKCRV